jgi:DNA-binding transcriptional LysR family regulator
LADADSITLDQLQDQVFIGFDRLVSPSLHRELTALLASRSIPYDPIIEATEYATILGLVASGQGVALVPASVQTFNPPTLSFVPVDDHDAVTSLLLLRRRGERSVVVRRAVELATELFDLPS